MIEPAFVRALYQYLNIRKVSLSADATVPPTIDVPVLRDGQKLPTHILAISDTSSSSPPILAPVPADLFAQKFRSDAIPSARPDSPSLVPHNESLPGTPRVITLPVIPLSVPHAPSIPLLLLYALGLQPHTTGMATHLLPLEAIEEFPSAAAMSQAMVRFCDDDQLRRYVAFNQGLWKNILALGPRDTQVIEMVQTAWNVTADARRIKQV
ncbi:hypothetical protein NEOLEDRAFT_1058858 [Neolentinus lepideus HHB14362 ss-1]|uniref:Uncharacterized protein n=1 Tax=Neolentinus lepideus HHB14362 ss-1 TaxID=1314782 RepID=A0A165UK23_9AGAM|nr:hypothetical protein NEOLEDRAFT_1058858 [Neolentinus lepideus HHB14362 ss-1]